MCVFVCVCVCVCVCVATYFIFFWWLSHFWLLHFLFVSCYPLHASGNPFNDYMGIAVAWPNHFDLQDLRTVRVAETRPRLPRRKPPGALRRFFDSILGTLIRCAIFLWFMFYYISIIYLSCATQRTSPPFLCECVFLGMGGGGDSWWSLNAIHVGRGRVNFLKEPLTFKPQPS